MKGEGMTGIVLIVGAIVLLALASVITYSEGPTAKVLLKQEATISRIEDAVTSFTKAQEAKVKELETVDQNIQAQVQAAFHKINYLEGKIEAAHNFKGLVEAMAARPVRVVVPEPKKRVERRAKPEERGSIVYKAMMDNPPTLRPPKLLRKKVKRK